MKKTILLLVTLLLVGCIKKKGLPENTLWIASAPAGTEFTKIDKEGKTIIPNGRYITPIGKSISTAPHPYGLTFVDYALIDATFYDAAEINNRDISEIPHPFVIETMELFKNQPKAIRNKIHFIHLNHTNPLLNLESEQSKEVLAKGFHIARINDIIAL